MVVSALWLVMPVLLLMLVWGWPWLWTRLIRDRIDLNVESLPTEVESGQTIPVRILIRNRSWVPCPFVEILLDLPEGLSWQSIPEGTEYKVGTIELTTRSLRGDGLRLRTFLLPRQEVTMTARCYGITRGLKSFSTAHASIHLNEGLGLQSLFLSRPVRGEVAVLPSLLSMGAGEAQWQDLLGDLVIHRWLFPDESLLRGIRLHQPQDRHRDIAWQAVARTGQWMTKEYDSSTEPRVVFILNAQFFDPHWWGTHTTELDTLCGLVSGLAQLFERQGASILFAANCVIPRDPLRLWHGRQTATSIRSLLGRAYAVANGPLDLVLHEVERHIPGQPPVYLFSSHFIPKQWETLARWSASGRHVTVISGPQPNWQQVPISGVKVVQPVSQAKLIPDTDTAVVQSRASS